MFLLNTHMLESANRKKISNEDAVRFQKLTHTKACPTKSNFFFLLVVGVEKITDFVAQLAGAEKLLQLS